MARSPARATAHPARPPLPGRAVPNPARESGPRPSALRSGGTDGRSPVRPSMRHLLDLAQLECAMLQLRIVRGQRNRFLIAGRFQNPEPADHFLTLAVRAIRDFQRLAVALQHTAFTVTQLLATQQLP